MNQENYNQKKLNVRLVLNLNSTHVYTNTNFNNIKYFKRVFILLY